MKVRAPKKWNALNHTETIFNKKLLLPLCYQRCLIEFMKQWMRLMKYEGECIKNMEWVESYQNCEMGMGSLVVCFCRHDQNPWPLWVFDNIVKILKSEQRYYISKKWTNKRFYNFLMYIRLLIFYTTYIRL